MNPDAPLEGQQARSLERMVGRTRDIRTWLYEDGKWTGGVTTWSTTQTAEKLVAGQNARLAGTGFEFRSSPPNDPKLSEPAGGQAS
jgi:hypothetical protein